MQNFCVFFRSFVLIQLLFHRFVINNFIFNIKNGRLSTSSEKSSYNWLFTYTTTLCKSFLSGFLNYSKSLKSFVKEKVELFLIYSKKKSDFIFLWKIDKLLRINRWILFRKIWNLSNFVHYFRIQIWLHRLNIIIIIQIIKYPQKLWSLNQHRSS